MTPGAKGGLHLRLSAPQFEQMELMATFMNMRLNQRLGMKIDDLPALDLASPSFRENPREALNQLRREAPLCRVLPLGAVGVLRFTDVDAVLQDFRIFGADAEPFPPGSEATSRGVSLLRDDPPRHTRLTKLVRQAFTADRAEAIETRIITCTRETLHRLADRSRCDFVRDVSEPISLQIVAGLLGVAEIDREHLRRLATEALCKGESHLAQDPDLSGCRHVPDGPSAAIFGERLKKAVDERRARPAHDVISALVHARDGDDRLAEAEVIDIAKILFVAGTELMSRALGMALHLLVTHPEQLRLVSNSPHLIASAVEECLRYDGPVIFTRRLVRHDCNLAGHDLPAGTMIAAMLTAANHDESAFSEPERFDVTRSIDRHLAFGGGPHACMGAALARAEMHIVLGEFLARFDGIELAAAPTPVRGLMRGFAELPVRFLPRARAAAIARDARPRAAVTAEDIAKKTDEALGLAARATEVVKVAFIRDLAPKVRLLVLNHPSGGTLTHFTAGSHIVLHLRDGGSAYRRAYSLLNAGFGDGLSYFIAVKLAEPSTGGSRFLFEKVRRGDEFVISVPANHFPLCREARGHVFVAGGIGITPFIAMRNELRLSGQTSELHYAYRNAETAAFIDLLKMTGDPGVHLYDGSLGQRLDVASILRRQARSTHVYTCGPKSLMDEVISRAVELGFSDDAIHTESFGTEAPNTGAAFTVSCRISGLELEVPENMTLLACLESAGVEVPHACMAGSCGLCKLPVVEGGIIHKDSVLTPAEKKGGRTIVSCISRAKERLVLNV